jgi:hypothetical protein
VASPVELILNPRRAPRARVRCDAELRHGQLVWSGETEDVSPGGCQVVTPRVIDPGREIKLAIRCGALSRTLLASGRVMWVRARAPARLGIAFEPGTPRDWFDALVRKTPEAIPADRAPRALRRDAMVRLGRAPERVVDFGADELDLLRRVGGGVTLDVLVRSFGERLPDRARAALFALIARRALVLDAGSAGAPGAWQQVLATRPGDVQARREVAVAPPPRARRAHEAQRLYDEALGFIGSGRLTLALDRLRDAAFLAPDDPLIASTAQRIARWA